MNRFDNLVSFSLLKKDIIIEYVIEESGEISKQCICVAKRLIVNASMWNNDSVPRSQIGMTTN